MCFALWSNRELSFDVGQLYNSVHSDILVLTLTFCLPANEKSQKCLCPITIFLYLLCVYHKL